MKLSYFYLLFFVLFAFSCTKNKIYKETYTFENYTWPKDKILTFETEIDTNQAGKAYDLNFSIRYITGFSLKYLNFNLEIQRPDESSASKDISIQMVTDDKKYRGEGMGDIWDLDYTLAEPFIFDKPGKYKFIIRPIIDETPIYFINKITLSVLTAKK